METTIIDSLLRTHGAYGLVIAILIYICIRQQKTLEEQYRTLATIARNSTTAMMACADMLRSQRERELETRVDSEFREAQARAERKLDLG